MEDYRVASKEEFEPVLEQFDEKDIIKDAIFMGIFSPQETQAYASSAHKGKMPTGISKLLMPSKDSTKEMESLVIPDEAILTQEGQEIHLEFNEQEKIIIPNSMLDGFGVIITKVGDKLSVGYKLIIVASGCILSIPTYREMLKRFQRIEIP